MFIAGPGGTETSYNMFLLLFTAFPLIWILSCGQKMYFMSYVPEFVTIRTEVHAQLYFLFLEQALVLSQLLVTLQLFVVKCAP